MRTARIREPGYYHIVSRVVDRRMVLDTKEKDRFRRTLRAVEGFTGCQVLTYAVLDNHFHVLLYVPARAEVSDELFLDRLSHLYPPPVLHTLAQALQTRRTEGQHASAETLKAAYTYRMCDPSEFMKTLKQRVTQSFNRRHGRKGTLWEEHFKSILVGGRSGTLATLAAYIDLNAVRARIVADPKVYRFCGYAEAVAGAAPARAGLARVLGAPDDRPWAQVAAEYRQLVYQAGAARGLRADGRPTRPGIAPEEVRRVLAEGGELPLPDLLRCRVRYFTVGLALGSRTYVDDVFQRYRARFGAQRRTGARPMRHGFAGLFTARRLGLDVITLSTA